MLWLHISGLPDYFFDFLLDILIRSSVSIRFPVG